MIYVAEVDHGGRVRVWSVLKTEDYILIARQALASRLIATSETFAATLEASRDANAFYEIFASAWHAMTAINSGRLPPDVVAPLEKSLKRHQHVASRGFGLHCGE